MWLLSCGIGIVWEYWAKTWFRFIAPNGLCLGKCCLKKTLTSDPGNLALSEESLNGKRDCIILFFTQKLKKIGKGNGTIGPED